MHRVIMSHIVCIQKPFIKHDKIEKKLIYNCISRNGYLHKINFDSAVFVVNRIRRVCVRVNFESFVLFCYSRYALIANAATIKKKVTINVEHTVESAEVWLT